MTKPWETDSCATMKAHYAVFSIPQAAALWCGVPENQIQQIVHEATQLSHSGLGRSIWVHPSVPCLEPRCRAISEAIEKGDLPHGREDADPVPTGEHVAYERRHFFGRDLRKWMEKAFPNEKPAFLFDDIERSTHTSISTDAYRALKAERDTLLTRLENAKSEYKKLRQEKDELESINQSLIAIAKKANTPGERAESTYLKIIGAMLELMLSESPGGQPYSSFTSQSAIISALTAHNEKKPGISQRTLEDKFAAAKREIHSI
ncbi:MAG: ATP-binding protein [Candidatus Thiodiazotropha sp. (ex Codakia rugifera)]|nr:ATP-binding protein [Candidatus Thiodiazotropha sp. (ex Codakia rugifera)]